MCSLLLLTFPAIIENSSDCPDSFSKNERKFFTLNLINILAPPIFIVYVISSLTSIFDNVYSHILHVFYVFFSHLFILFFTSDTNKQTPAL